MTARKNRLPLRELQLKLILSFQIVALICLLLHFFIMNSSMTDLAAKLAEPSPIVSQYIMELGIKNLCIVTALLIPLTLALGVLVTFRIAGPVYRFKKYFQAIAAGEDPGPCMVREKDEFQDLCRHINEAMSVLKQRSEESSEANVDSDASTSSKYAECG